MLDWYREEDAGDLRRNELDESVENMTALNALEGASERQDRTEPVLVQNLGHVGDNTQDFFVGCLLREMSDWYRRNESNESFENMTALNALEGVRERQVRKVTRAS